MIFARLIPAYFGQIFCHINILIASWVFNGRGINLSHDINPSLMALQAEVSPHHDRGKIPLSPIKPNYASNIRRVVLRGDEEKKNVTGKALLILGGHWDDTLPFPIFTNLSCCHLNVFLLRHGYSKWLNRNINTKFD